MVFANHIVCDSDSRRMIQREELRKFPDKQGLRNVTCKDATEQEVKPQYITIHNVTSKRKEKGKEIFCTH